MLWTGSGGQALRRVLLGGVLALTAGCVDIMAAASGQATIDNRPYHKAGVTQAEITADRFACIREMIPEWKSGQDDRLHVCMRQKGYTVYGQRDSS